MPDKKPWFPRAWIAYDENLSARRPRPLALERPPSSMSDFSSADAHLAQGRANINGHPRVTIRSHCTRLLGYDYAITVSFYGSSIVRTAPIVLAAGNFSLERFPFSFNASRCSRRYSWNSTMDEWNHLWTNASSGTEQLHRLTLFRPRFRIRVPMKLLLRRSLYNARFKMASVIWEEK